MTIYSSPKLHPPTMPSGEDAELRHRFDELRELVVQVAELVQDTRRRHKFAPAELEPRRCPCCGGQGFAVSFEELERVAEGKRPTSLFEAVLRRFSR